MCAYATHFVGMDDAEEIIQDMMVGIWERRKDIAIESSLNGYLFRTVQNKCVNHIDRLRLHERVHSFLACNRQKLFEDPDFYVVEELTQKNRGRIEETSGKISRSFCPEPH